MRSDERRTRIPAMVLGMAIGGAVVLAVRGLALADATRIPPSWVNGVALAVAASGLALSWLARSPVARRVRPSRTVLATASAALASVAVASYWGLGNDALGVHSWEHYHYYVGGKYFAELSYRGLYACAAVAESERVGAEEMAGRRMRDLATDEVVPVEGALADPAACTRRFTPERWRAFGDDVMWFRARMGRLWDRMQQDHGFNPPPTWVLGGRLLAAVGPASERTQRTLALVDPVLLAAMFATIAWAFGAHVLWVALIVWGTQVPGAGTWTAGALLRQDWLLLVVAAVGLARRGWPMAAGVAIASAVALRIFPVFLLGLPALVIVRRAWQAGAIGRFDRRFTAGVVAGVLVWFALTTAVFGLEAWRAFAEHIAVHRLAPLANHVGLRAILAQSWDGRWTEVMRPGETDPFSVWKAMRRETFAERQTLYLVLAGAFATFAAIAGWRIRRLWIAMAASAVVILVAVDVASYYCAVFIVLALLAAATRAEEWLALGAVVASRAVNALPLATDNPDVRYTAQAVVFLTWGVLALLLLAWRPRRRVRATVAVAGPARAARRRSAR